MAGKTTFTINIQHGLGNISRTSDVLNTEEYLEMRREAYHNDSIKDPLNYNIPDEFNALIFSCGIQIVTQIGKVELIGKIAQFTQCNSTVTGGNQYSQYLLKRWISKGKSSVMPGDFSNQKASLHFNIMTKSMK